MNRLPPTRAAHSAAQHSAALYRSQAHRSQAHRSRIAVRLAFLAAFLAVFVAIVPDAAAQRRRPKDGPANAPSTCPYTAGEPEALAAAGIVSLGGFPFATTDTAAIDKAYPLLDIRWIETAHMRIGFGIGEYSVRNDERAKIDAELEQLRRGLPTVPKRPRTLEPWLRAHLFAQRAEQHYARILDVLRVDPAAFPDGTKLWDTTGKYMGMGPYLGQKGKFELLILPTGAAVKQFLSDNFGLQVEGTQRWNVKERDALLLVIPAEAGSARRDTGLHCHVVFNLTTNFIDGYKHYSYELPVWLREALAHAMEREIDPRFNSFTYSEGAAGERVTKTDWLAETRKLVRTAAAPTMAELVNISAYGDLEGRHHLASWSMTEFLLRAHPEAYAAIQDALNGRTTADGFTDGSNLKDAHRDAFREHLGMSYAAFDSAWQTWVMTPAAEGQGAGTGGDEPPPLVPPFGGPPVGD